jgi:hypothetical protein
MDLLAEHFATNKNWRAISETLKRHGATLQEIAFLADERVELNAMTSDEFIAFIERKFAEHGLSKVVPDSDVIERHARNVIEGRLLDNAVAKLAAKIKEQAATIALPEDLRQTIEAELKVSPTFSWDEAVFDLVADLADGDE